MPRASQGQPALPQFPSDETVQPVLRSRERDQSPEPLHAVTVGVTVIASVAVVLALQFARALLVPIVVGVLVSYALDPLVTSLVARRVPRSIAATLTFLLILAGVAGIGYGVGNQGAALVQNLPRAAQRLREAIEPDGDAGTGAVAQMRRAADQLHQLSTPASSDRESQEIRKVQVEPRSFDFTDYVLSGSITAVGLAADLVVVIFLAYYLLLVGDLFRRRIVEIAGPTLTRKKITLQILNDISEQISAYLFIRALISIIVAVLTGVVLWMAGLAQPAVWGLIAGALNVVPYLGPATTAAAIAFAAFLQFHTVTMGAVAGGLTVFVACIEAYGVTPWLTRRATQMNPVAVFVGLAFWGWLWGVPGLLLAVPLLMILKAVCEHIEMLEPVVSLLKA